MARYVPKTYNNKRILRLIVGAVITVALSIVILFLILFFIFRGYEVDGKLEIPWLIDDAEPTLPPPETGRDNENEEDLPEDSQPQDETDTDEPLVE